jgi:hypothetical protein
MDEEELKKANYQLGLLRRTFKGRSWQMLFLIGVLLLVIFLLLIIFILSIY